MPERLLTDAEQAILETRTRALAERGSVSSRAERLDAVAVVVGGERYALDASIVQTVIALSRITALPHAPAHVAGLIVHAGVVMPVFHLRAILDLPLSALPERGHVLLVGDQHPELALVVDVVEGVHPLDLTKLGAPPASLSPGARELVRGTDDNGVPLLDGRALLRSERLYVDITPSLLDRPRGTS